MELTWTGIGVIVAILGHGFFSIWWASKVNTLLDVVQKDLGEMVSEMKSHKQTTFTREEAARELAICEKERTALWKKVDALTEKVNSAT